jgi:hypothetical protein
MTYDALEALGRERLSRNFYMREFLYSEIANWHQLRNVPDHPNHALRVGRELCTELLEPLQMRFGRVHIRSGYRSPEVNAFGNRNQLNCASNEKNYAGHIWDYPDTGGHYGATACIVVPALADYIVQGGSWTAMAWWIHDHLPYSSLCFFAKLGAFNIGWHEVPERSIDSFAAPKGCLTKKGMANHADDHAHEYAELLRFVDAGVLAPELAQLPRRAEPIVPPALPRAKRLSTELDTVSPASTTESSGAVHYRAVHTMTAWRRAGHQSLHNAIHGKDGAAALFARKVRIKYEVHGDPLYVVVWRDGETSGTVIRPHPANVGEVELANIPIAHIERMEAQSVASTSELTRYFS